MSIKASPTSRNLPVLNFEIAMPGLEVTELDTEAGRLQWNLAQSLDDVPLSPWERTVPMDLL